MTVTVLHAASSLFAYFTYRTYHPILQAYRKIHNILYCRAVIFNILITHFDLRLILQ